MCSVVSIFNIDTDLRMSGMEDTVVEKVPAILCISALVVAFYKEKEKCFLGVLYLLHTFPFKHCIQVCLATRCKTHHCGSSRF